MNSSHYIGKLSQRIMVACALSAICVSTVPSIAWAAPSSQELSKEREGLEVQLAEAQQYLDQLNGEMDVALQELEESREKLTATSKEVDKTQAQVDESEERLVEKRDALCVNMRDNYKIGLSSTIDFLLGSTSFEDLVGRIYYLDKVGDARAAEIQEVNRLAEEYAKRQKKLKKAQARLEKNVDTYEAKTVEYEEMIYGAQEYRDGLDEEVQRILEEEEAARQAEEEAARKKAEEEARKKAEEEAAKKAEEEAQKAEEESQEEEPSPEAEPTAEDSGPEAETTVSYVHKAKPGDEDKLIYIQWGSRQNVCWPVKGGSKSGKIECGSETLIMATILLTGDYSITPDSLLAGLEKKYGTISSSQTYYKVLQYIEEKYGVHHRSVGHLSAKQAKRILASGHLISAGGGCEGREGLPFCKAPGVKPRCCHGHVVLFYKYADGIFWAKDSAPGDGAAMCAYPDGPLTVTHQGAVNGRCSRNGQKVTYDNYADAFLGNSWNTELWI